jgi:biotin carboxyl carrier protein
VTDETSGRTPATSGDAPGSGLEALTEEVLPALIARLRTSRLGELEVRTADWRVRLRRDANASVRATAAGAVHVGADEPEGLGVSIARSSAVGYFKPGPDLVVGHSVQSGDLLGSIDMLGIVQEVTAPEAGIVAAVLAEDGQAVEYGQALAEIDPLDLGADDAEGLA